jgi:hypothetical protein
MELGLLKRLPALFSSLFPAILLNIKKFRWKFWNPPLTYKKNRFKEK